MSLTFKVVTTLVPVDLEIDGKIEPYELREMSAAARDSYLDVMSDRLRFDKDGNTAGVKKFEGMQADLLSRCLYRHNALAPVGKSVIQGWPSSVVAGLFAEAQKINLLGTGKEGTVEAKND